MKQFRILRIKKERGFTLIELMIVVAIIGILAAIAIPNFRNYQLKAKRNELPTNLKAIRTAELSYQAEKGHFQPLTATPTGSLKASKRKFIDQGGFANVGWQPTGQVYGTYFSQGPLTPTTMVGYAKSDIDQDGVNATISFTANITNPRFSTTPTYLTDHSIF